MQSQDSKIVIIRGNNHYYQKISFFLVLITAVLILGLAYSPVGKSLILGALVFTLVTAIRRLTVLRRLSEKLKIGAEGMWARNCWKPQRVNFEDIAKWIICSQSHSPGTIVEIYTSSMNRK